MVRRLFAVLLFCAAFGVGRPASGQTFFVVDSFTVGANTMLEAHNATPGGAWTRQTGGSGIILNAAADNARNVAATDWSVYTNATSPAAEVVVVASVTFSNASTNNFVDLFGRGSLSLLNAYSVRVVASGANNVSLFRWSGGAPTMLAQNTVAITIPSTIMVVLSLKNASKSVEINGVSVASSADNTVTGVGLVALGMQSNVAAQTIVDSFFASTFAPTAVDRVDATATRDATRTLVEWSTSREVQNLGFRIFRDDGNGPVQVSRGLVAGAAFMVAGASLPAGNTYRWIDSDPRAKTAKAWWIEDVDLHGHSVRHGPIVPRKGSIDSRVALSPTFVDSGQKVGVASPTRLRPASLGTSTASDRRRAIASFVGSTEKQRQLAAEDAIKIGVAVDGLYRISRADLLVAGLDLQAVRLYADGMEVPVAIDGDELLFYGRALDTASTATRIYWLVSNEGAGLRMASASSTTAPVSARRSFLATAERRDKIYFVTFQRDIAGDNFVGPLVSTDASKPTIQTLQLRHIDRTATTATVTVELQGSSDVDAEASHHVVVSLNGERVGDLTFDALAQTKASFDVPAALLVDGDNSIAFAALNGDADASAVISAAITYAHTLDADDDRLLAIVDGGAQTSIAGFTSNEVEIVDITDERNPIRIVPRIENGTATFIPPSSGPRTILALESSKLAQATSIVRNEPSSLINAFNAAGADVVIISHPPFVSALAPLVQLRQSQGMSVIVAKTDDIYDEFNFGAKDPQAIRSFLLNAKRWQKPPRYVLLVGDASFDERVYLGLGDFDFVPTKLVMADLLLTASDAWFTDFDEDGAPDVPIGRLSARTPDDVAAEVKKIVAYETSAAPATRKIMLVSDSDPNLDFHANSASLEASIPQGFDVVDVDAHEIGPSAARQQLLGGFSDALLVNYIGHGSVEIWSNYSFFARDDVAALPVSDRAPIVVAMTCLNGYFHDLYTDSLAEALQRAPNGAVAVWASSSLTSPEAQLPANEVLVRTLLGSADIRLGDAVVAAQKSSFTPDIRRTFILFGDPAMRVRTQ